MDDRTARTLPETLPNTRPAASSGALAGALPRWVPENVCRYLAHTEVGRPIRDLARGAGCHASTVMRQIRRIEARRDDPLVDAALRALGHLCGAVDDAVAGVPDDTTLQREALRVLRRMCESGAVLAVARDMDKAVVIRDADAGKGTRTAVVGAEIARAMALNEWISCSSPGPTPGRISRYRITAGGRAALGRIVAGAENLARQRTESGFAEAQTSFSGRAPVGGATARMRYNIADSPLTALARRRDKEGQPFLGDDLVRAGERLREDFELAQMGTRVTQNWDDFLTGGARGGLESGDPSGPEGARDRVARALSDLGPGLSDVALRCCCYLEGLEQAEKRMGWSARSGKIVLRIALQRLKRHYDDPSVAARQMVG